MKLRLTGSLVALGLACTVASPSGAQDQVFDSNGVRIRFVAQGEGEPIVLIHGFGGSVATWLDSGVFSDLATDHRVIALDCRGHGKSDKPHDPAQYSVEMSKDVARLLEHLGLPRAHIVGYSQGAEVTAQLLTMSPERFITATLGGSPPLYGWTREQEEFAERDAEELHEGMMRTILTRLAPADEPPPTDAEIRAFSESRLAGQDRHALAAVARSRSARKTTKEQLAAVEVPTQAIVGSEDPLARDATALQKVIPSLKLVVIEGATHSGERSALRRDEFVAAIRSFIADNRVP